MKYLLFLLFFVHSSYSCNRICDEIKNKEARIKILKKQVIILKEIQEVKKIKQKAVLTLRKAEDKMEKSQDELNYLFSKEFNTFLEE